MHMTEGQWQAWRDLHESNIRFHEARCRDIDREFALKMCLLAGVMMALLIIACTC
jgi:hypothetical protein